MKILVVEDEIHIAEVIRKGLETQHYSVDVALDGKIGLTKALESIYDVIILDVMLPEVSGIKICETIRQASLEVPIIFLTACNTDEDKARGLAAGANEYLVKPVALGDLIAKIKNLTAKPDETDLIADKNVNLETISKYKASELNEKILDNAPVSIITIDKIGNITSANKYYQTFARTENYLGHNIFNSGFFVRENLVDDYRQLLTNGTVVRKENCYEKNNKGEDKYLKILAVPLRDDQGNIEGALSMAVDNTEAVLFKRKLQELNNDLEKKIEERTEQLNEANNELATVLNLKSIFMADVSHEMRTSLAIIQGNLELMSLGCVAKSEQTETYDQVFYEIRRISTMLADLNMLSSTDKSIQKMDFEILDINQLIKSVCKSLRVVADEKNITIEYQNEAEILEVTADKGKIERLLMNLIRNAIKYNNNNGHVNVWAEALNGNIVVKVQDNGIGIPEADLPHVFERFYRVDKARTRLEGGFGLGLAICKWITELHSGKIEVSSQLNLGSIFTVRLPQTVQADKLDKD